MDEFEVTYGNDDGYAGGSRPHSFEIDASELDENMSEDELKSLFWESMEEDFKQRHLNLYSDQESEFIVWAKEQIAQMQKEYDRN